MSEPGILHFEAHLSEGTAVGIYDSSVITGEKIMALLAERAKNWPATLLYDLPVAEAR